VYIYVIWELGVHCESEAVSGCRQWAGRELALSLLLLVSCHKYWMLAHCVSTAARLQR